MLCGSLADAHIPKYCPSRSPCLDSCNLRDASSALCYSTPHCLLGITSCPSPRDVLSLMQTVERKLACCLDRPWKAHQHYHQPCQRDAVSKKSPVLVRERAGGTWLREASSCRCSKQAETRPSAGAVPRSAICSSSWQLLWRHGSSASN